jgi:hypothetical protein
LVYTHFFLFVFRHHQHQHPRLFLLRLYSSNRALFVKHSP